jgi:hypothetical protein
VPGWPLTRCLPGDDLEDGDHPAFGRTFDLPALLNNLAVRRIVKSITLTVDRYSAPFQCLRLSGRADEPKRAPPAFIRYNLETGSYTAMNPPEREEISVDPKDVEALRFNLEQDSPLYTIGAKTFHWVKARGV